MVGILVAMSLAAGAVMAQQAGAGKQRENPKGPIKVFILAGQSNMEGQGVVSMDGEKDYNGGKGNLVWSMMNSKSAEKMKCLKNDKGEWVVRDDVQISFKVGDQVRKGGLTVGYTGYGGSSHIGPELGFGFVMGDYYEEPGAFDQDGLGRQEPVRGFQAAKFRRPGRALLHEDGGRGARGLGWAGGSEIRDCGLCLAAGLERHVYQRWRFLNMRGISSTW